jgi:hypothetical protein
MLGLGLMANKTVLNKNYFQCTIKTDNTSAGSSTDHQFSLPLESGGTYNFTIDWGDGVRNRITVYNQVEVTHTYSAIGTYIIKIWGTCIGFRFASLGDCKKILTITKWGNLELGNSNRYFDGCSNLSIITTDTLKNPTMTDASYFMYGCINLNSDLYWLNSENIDNMGNLCGNCSTFNGNVSRLNTSKVRTMSGMFANDIEFNKPVPFNTENVEDMSYMFISNYKFNQPLLFNTAKVRTMNSMLYYAADFNQDISSWNIELVDDMTNILYLAWSFSRTNYDLALISWANQNVQDGVQFRCMAQYTSGSPAEIARNHLISEHDWVITDGGGF